jgi:hypothetical protein
VARDGRTILQTLAPYGCLLLGYAVTVPLTMAVAAHAADAALAASGRCEGLGWGCQPGGDVAAYVALLLAVPELAASFLAVIAADLLARRDPERRRTWLPVTVAMASSLLPVAVFVVLLAAG